MIPERTRHLAFGDVAAVWSLLTDLDVAGVIDEVVGARRSDAGASVGTYLALAALGRLVAPRSKKAFADWWATTAGDRFTKISPKVLDHRKFWDAMHTVDAEALQDISARLAARMIDVFDLDTSSVALDMTNFATYIDTTNDKAPIAQRGKAKQKRTDLRLVGLGMVVTRAGGIPLVWHAYPGNRPDVTQFPTLIEHLKQRYTHLADHAADTDGAAVTDWPSMTVVFDAGQNSTANFEHLRNSGLHYVGSVPPSDCPDLLALPAADRPRLTWTVNNTKRQALEENIFGKRILITDHDDWTVADVVAGYRSQSEIEFGFRQLKDPHEVSFSPMYHWTENNIAVHTFTCVLALQLAHLLRLKAHRAGHDLSVKALLDTLGGIGETVLIYPSTGGRPKARRMTTEMSTDQQALYDLFNLHRWAPQPTT